MDYKELIDDCVARLNELSDRFNKIDLHVKESKDFTESFNALQELQDNIEIVSSKLYSIPLSFRGMCGRELGDILYRAERRARMFITEIEDLKKEIKGSDDLNSVRIVGIMFPNQEDRDEYYNDF